MMKAAGSSPSSSACWLHLACSALRNLRGVVRDHAWRTRCRAEGLFKLEEIRGFLFHRCGKPLAVLRGLGIDICTWNISAQTNYHSVSIKRHTNTKVLKLHLFTRSRELLIKISQSLFVTFANWRSQYAQSLRPAFDSTES